MVSEYRILCAWTTCSALIILQVAVAYTDPDACPRGGARTVEPQPTDLPGCRLEESAADISQVLKKQDTMSPTHEALVEEGTSLYAAPHSEIEKEVDKSDEPIEAEATFDNEPTRGCQIPTGKITKQEVKDLSSDMWKADVNRVKVEVDLQTQLGDNTKVDESPRKLFTKVPQGTFKNEVVTRLIDLFDNYYPTSGLIEDTSPIEKVEVDAFLDAVINSEVMDMVRIFLDKKGIVDGDPNQFRKEMKRLWFTYYDRNASGNKEYSSGFEHVFIGEWKKSTTSGFHNWIRMHYLEKQGKLNYHGYFKEKKLDDTTFLSLQFSWETHLKQLTSLFLGTSPEFDFALFTLCYYSYPGKGCRVHLGNADVTVVSYVHCYRNNHYPGTVYASD